MDAPDKIPVINALDDDDARQRFELVITLFRAALAPWLNQEIDRIGENQAVIISACAAFAGMTVGHMTVVGAMQPHDRRRAEKVVTVNFRNGIRMGLAEAGAAVKRAGPLQ